MTHPQQPVTEDEEEDDSQMRNQPPDSTHLVRRGALVPSKMDADQDSGNDHSTDTTSGSTR